MSRHVVRLFCMLAGSAALVAVSPRDATAGPFSDWLFGKHAAYYPPGYVPVAPAPVAPVAGVAQTSYYAPATAPTLPYRLTPVTSFYGTGNVYPTYTGYGAAPTTAYSPAVGYSPVAAYSPVAGYSPVASYSPAVAAPVTSYAYPTNAVAPVTAYAYPTTAAVAPVTAYAYPTAAAPVTAAYPVYPAYQAYRPGLFSGLRRWFRPSWPWGYGYTTSYYPAQVTYYRPVTTLAPVTGVPTTSLSACTSYEPQIQRLPTSTLQPPPAPIAGGCGSCNSAPAYAPTYAPTADYPTTPGTYPPASGNIVPNYNAAPTTPGTTSPSDIMPVPQPQLAPTSSYYNYGSTSPSTVLPQSETSPYSSSTTPSPYSSSTTPPTSSGMQPLLNAPATSDNSSGGYVEPRPIPAPSTTPYFGRSDEERSAKALQAGFKTIQWTSRPEAAAPPARNVGTTLREPSSTAPARAPSAPAPGAPNRSRYDDRGWR